MWHGLDGKKAAPAKIKTVAHRDCKASLAVINISYVIATCLGVLEFATHFAASMQITVD